jgi:hypothetical protein
MDHVGKLVTVSLNRYGVAEKIIFADERSKNDKFPYDLFIKNRINGSSQAIGTGVISLKST